MRLLSDIMMVGLDLFSVIVVVSMIVLCLVMLLLEGVWKVVLEMLVGVDIVVFFEIVDLKEWLVGF